MHIHLILKFMRVTNGRWILSCPRRSFLWDWHEIYPVVWYSPGLDPWNILIKLTKMQILCLQLCSWVTLLINWCLYMQRIALVYCVVALIETFTSKLRPTTLSPGHLSIFTSYRWQWWEYIDNTFHIFKIKLKKLNKIIIEIVNNCFD